MYRQIRKLVVMSEIIWIEVVPVLQWPRLHDYDNRYIYCQSSTYSIFKGLPSIAIERSVIVIAIHLPSSNMSVCCNHLTMVYTASLSHPNP